MLPARILLAEDDADDQKFFHEFMEDRSDIALLSVAKNGEEVFELLSKIPETGQLPDFIILDQNMPKRNGLQTLQMLKENSLYEKIPVFIYSTYTDDALKQQSIRAGAASVFPKPYTAEGYHSMVDAMLGHVR